MKKAGILGGGQLGRMLLQEAANFPVETYVLENDPACPAAHLCHHFTPGNIRSYDDVIAFGESLDVLTIEIESVNVEALEALEKKGVQVIPSSSVLRTIQNKITQKAFYREHGIPTADFMVTNNRRHLAENIDFLPAVHKIGEGGYDGKGVQIIRDSSEIHRGFDAPAVLERLVDIHQEVAVIVGMDHLGKAAIYPTVEMVFDPYLNLLDYQLCPADLRGEVLWKVEAIAMKLAKALGSPGLFAIEMLIDREGEVWVNETAPRVHNSGHHTIEAHYCSQYEMLWRIMLQLPLGNTEMIAPSALVNLIGSEHHAGPPVYEGLTELLRLRGVYQHIYGKMETRPGRKMGHVTVLGTDRTDVLHKAKQVKETLKVVSETVQPPAV
jgi:5-(carboxyamino)imidazole ribonucleotide synthase